MTDFLIHEHDDTVGVATVDIEAGREAEGLFMDTQEEIKVKALQDIPLGHKIALRDHSNGEGVIKYGHDIGKVVNDFKKGEHVHIHDLKTRRW